MLSCSKVLARSARILTLDKTRASKPAEVLHSVLLLVDTYFKSGFSFTSQRPIEITKVGEQWSCAQIVRQMFTVEASSCLQIAAIHKEFSTEPYKMKLLERVNVKYICRRHCLAFYGTANCLWLTCTR